LANNDENIDPISEEFLRILKHFKKTPGLGGSNIELIKHTPFLLLIWLLDLINVLENRLYTI
jgi:hypothetical protein